MLICFGRSLFELGLSNPCCNAKFSFIHTRVRRHVHTTVWKLKFRHQICWGHYTKNLPKQQKTGISSSFKPTSASLIRSQRLQTIFSVVKILLRILYPLSRYEPSAFAVSIALQQCITDDLYTNCSSQKQGRCKFKKKNCLIRNSQVMSSRIGAGILHSSQK